jgi:primosomal protein N'
VRFPHTIPQLPASVGLKKLGEKEKQIFVALIKRGYKFTYCKRCRVTRHQTTCYQQLSFFYKALEENSEN